MNFLHSLLYIASYIVMLGACSSCVATDHSLILWIVYTNSGMSNPGVAYIPPMEQGSVSGYVFALVVLSLPTATPLRRAPAHAHTFCAPGKRDATTWLILSVLYKQCDR